jgi:type III secretory pathway lipoprotein EscJ
MEKGWSKVYVDTVPYKVDIICGVLDENGIQNVKMNKQDSSYQIFGEIEVYVPESEFAKAIELIVKAEI